jgi:hypothetical protein
MDFNKAAGWMLDHLLAWLGTDNENPALIVTAIT